MKLHDKASLIQKSGGVALDIGVIRFDQAISPTALPGPDENLLTASTLGSFPARNMPSMHTPWTAHSRILGGGTIFYLCGSMGYMFGVAPAT
jgi:hypothetical protein